MQNPTSPAQSIVTYLACSTRLSLTSPAHFGRRRPRLSTSVVTHLASVDRPHPTPVDTGISHLTSLSESREIWLQPESHYLPARPESPPLGEWLPIRNLMNSFVGVHPHPRAERATLDRRGIVPGSMARTTWSLVSIWDRPSRRNVADHSLVTALPALSLLSHFPSISPLTYHHFRDTSSVSPRCAVHPHFPSGFSIS